jgi:tRNA pseudouridine38-40 synthase
MPRYKLLIEYDGSPFAGWQVQANGPSIQGRLEAVFAILDPDRPSVRGAGRTDAGVHAYGQVAHVDLGREWQPFRLREALNANLRPDPIAVLAVEPVAPDFDARFSARSRSYLYRILCRRAPPALERVRVWHVARDLDAAAMHAAAQTILGKHDFTTFRSAQCQAASALRTLDRLDVSRRGEEIHVVAEARSFLHNQVRSLAGSLKLVGEGRWPVARLGKALAARDRAACGTVAPPDGLYLVRVTY